MFRILFFFFLLTGFLSANERADKLWSDANRFYSQAEEKVRKAAHDEAIVLFKASLDMLKKIQYEFPAWNTSVVKNRVKGCTERLGAAEELILQSIKSFSKDELIERLKITQIARAKFSKAMMILYEDLNRTKGELDITKKALDKARNAAGSRVADEAHLDKLTFENLKLRKSLRDLETQMLVVKDSSEDVKTSGKVNTEVLKYKKLQEEAVAKEEKLRTEKIELAAQLKELSFKYTDLLNREKNFNKKFKQVENAMRSWQTEAKKEKDSRLKHQNGALEFKEKLTLESQRLKDSRFREAELINALAALKKNGANPKMLANVTDRNAELLKENTRLRKVEIDLSAKNRTLANNFERNVLLLKNHVDDSAKTSVENEELKNRNRTLQETAQKMDKSLRAFKSERKSLENDIRSLKSQIKILQKVVDDYKQNGNPKKDGKQVDQKLLQAYEKKSKETQEKIIFLEKSLRQAQIRNNALREENISGDEEVIKKYVQTRDELKLTKEKVRKLYSRLKTFEGGVDNVTLDTMGSIDKEENEKLKKFNDLLFQASRQKEPSAAIGLYTKALKVRPESFDALLRIGMLFYEQRLFHDAAIHLQKAFYIQPDEPNMLLALGISMIELNKLELAVSALSRLVGKYPEDSQAHLQLGTVLQGLGWYEAAISHLEKSFKIDSENGDAAFNLAVCYLALQEPDVVKARIYYQKAIELGIVKDPVLEKYFQ